MPRPLAMLRGHAHPGVSIALVTATLLIAATGASAVTVRMTSNDPAHHASAPAAAPVKPAPTHLALPAPPVPASLPSGTLASVPTASVPLVPRARHLVVATLVVSSTRTLSKNQIAAIRALPGVARLQTVAIGGVHVDGHRSVLLGVDPKSFRPWTPSLTAASQPLWQSIASGELTASFDMGHDASLPLGQTVPVSTARRSVPTRIGAFASVGMAGIDAVVSAQRAAQLGMHFGTGLLVSAPTADPLALRTAVRKVIGSRGRAWLLRQMIVIRDAGEFLTRVQINAVLQAAASRVGLPYVWGATGPSSFDCSGLVLWSFAHAGVRMPRVSQQQWFAGAHVPYSAARPGDLIFWHYDPTDPSDIDHVAIYAGNGMMLVAPHTGENVEYVPVPLNNMAGVVRVDPSVAAQI